MGTWAGWVSKPTWKRYRAAWYVQRTLTRPGPPSVTPFFIVLCVRKLFPAFCILCDIPVRMCTYAQPNKKPANFAYAIVEVRT